MITLKMILKIDEWMRSLAERGAGCQDQEVHPERLPKRAKRAVTLGRDDSPLQAPADGDANFAQLDRRAQAAGRRR